MIDRSVTEKRSALIWFSHELYMPDHTGGKYIADC